MRVLTWFRNNNNNFHQLSTVDLSHSHFSGLEGVYIIWYKPKLDIIQTVYVGKGEIRERLRSHQNDAQIRLYGPSSGNTLYVSWANVPSDLQDGIEKYLHEKLRPLLGQRSPDATPVPVNMPWG